jgi:hypothetical protein
MLYVGFDVFAVTSMKYVFWVVVLFSLVGPDDGDSNTSETSVNFYQTTWCYSTVDTYVRSLYASRTPFLSYLANADFCQMKELLKEVDFIPW